MTTKKEFLKMFPEAAKAIKNCSTWEYEPEYWDSGDDFYEFCMDCREYPDGHWMSMSYHLGYRVEDDGTIWCDEWRQWDGDWDIVGSFELKNNSDSKWCTQNYKEAEASHKAYAKWVVENKTDPLGTYWVRKTFSAEKRYIWVLEKTVGEDTFTVRSIFGVAGKRRTYLRDAPPEVLGYVRPSDYTWSAIRRLAKQGTKRKGQVWRFIENGVIEIEDTLSVTLPNENWEVELVAAAERHLGEK